MWRFAWRFARVLELQTFANTVLKLFGERFFLCRGGGAQLDTHSPCEACLFSSLWARVLPYNTTGDGSVRL